MALKAFQPSHVHQEMVIDLHDQMAALFNDCGHLRILALQALNVPLFFVESFLDEAIQVSQGV